MVSTSSEQLERSFSWGWWQCGGRELESWRVCQAHGFHLFKVKEGGSVPGPSGLAECSSHTGEAWVRTEPSACSDCPEFCSARGVLVAVTNSLPVGNCVDKSRQ